MRKLSRWMPPLPPSPPPRTRDWILLLTIFGGILAIIVAAFVESPASVVISFLVVFSLPWIFGNQWAEQEDRRLANERKGENIGTFARVFDRRSEPFDPWVVRATWDALQCYVAIPLRPTDRLIEDLCIADEEIDMALLVEVATRSRHSLDGLEANPYFAKFSSFRNVSVGDFVKLISWQPKIETDPGL